MVTAKRTGPYDYQGLLRFEKGKLRKSVRSFAFGFSFTAPPTLSFGEILRMMLKRQILTKPFARGRKGLSFKPNLE
jgi:hypothetical protein